MKKLKGDLMNYWTVSERSALRKVFSSNYAKRAKSDAQILRRASQKRSLQNRSYRAIETQAYRMGLSKTSIW